MKAPQIPQAIVRVHSHGRLFDRTTGTKVSMFPCYVMDFIDGRASGEYFATTPTDERTFVRIVDTVVDAIRYLHEHQVGHFDIKPDNVLINRSGDAVISDLGTAKQVSDSTAETIIACTTRYADPELVTVLTPDPFR